MSANDTSATGVIAFLREFKLRVVLLSLAVVTPCFWHRRIEAGDLASHVYNAWLAQLIAKGQAPGLYIVRQWHNILFDVTLQRAANLVGIAAAQRIVVAVCVLIFFWGVFAFVRSLSDALPWQLTPCIVMLAYGYSFNMGFMNYYLSLGLACFGLAIVRRRHLIDWIGGVILALVAFLAHPIGFLWMVGTLAYLAVRERIPGWWKLVLPLSSGAVFVAVYWYTSHRPALSADWDRGPFYLYNGADQLALYGNRYIGLAGVAFIFGVLCFAADVYLRRRNNIPWKLFALPFELFAVTFCATALLPENLRPSPDSGWIGMLGSRLTTISAVLGLCFLGIVKPRKWQLAGFTLCAVLFFLFLYQDTGWLNRLEANAEDLTANLTPGTRIIVTASGQQGWRIPFIAHSIERACIGHCFSYANYEPASREFRIRAQKGSPVATDSTDTAEDMASGEYEVDDTDLPLKQIYQCNSNDLTQLCIRDLQVGETNGRLSFKLPSR